MAREKANFTVGGANDILVKMIDEFVKNDKYAKDEQQRIIDRHYCRKTIMEFCETCKLCSTSYIEYYEQRLR